VSGAVSWRVGELGAGTYAVGCAGVGHGVASVAVGDVFVDEGTLAGGAVLLSVLDGGLDGEDVHAVDLQTGDVLAALVVLGDGRRAVGSGTHAVLVVLAAEDDGELPQTGHVVGLEDLTLVGGTVTVEGEGDLLLALVLLGKGDTSADGDLGTDDTVSAVEAGREHVHGTALSVGDTLPPAEQLADDALDGAAAHHGEAVAAVGGDEVVGALDGVLNTDGDGLLAGGQMAETADLLLLVQPVGGHLHAAAGCQRCLRAIGERVCDGQSYRTATMS
jgi:hypothetical protein